MQTKNEQLDTKDRLALALLEILSSGKPISKVRVKELTDACGVDRQTFYYYFKNIAEATEYIYKRELVLVFKREGCPDITQIDWKTRIARILALLEEKPVLQKIIMPILGDAALREELRVLIIQELEREFLPHLRETGMKETECIERLGYIALMLESILIDWLKGDIKSEVPQILDRIEEMLQDYLAGIAVRLARENRALQPE